MAFKLCANLSMQFNESKNLLERYKLAAEAGFKAVECAFPYDYSIEELKKVILISLVCSSISWQSISNILASRQKLKPMLNKY